MKGATKAGATPTFRFCPQEAQAYGKPAPGGGFIVEAGSTAMRHGSPRVKRDKRDELIASGVLREDANPRLYRFTRDWTFTSASKAAGFIKDGNASGPSLWKDADTGETLRGYLVKTSGS